MRNLMFISLLIIGVNSFGDVDLVKDGQPLAEIVIAEEATPSVKTAAAEFQKHLQKISGAKLNIVNISEIIMCKSYRNYTQFYMEDGEKITVSKTIKNFNDFLIENGFIKPHRQYLVNVNHIRSFEKTNGNLIKLTRDLEVPVSSRKRDMLLEVIQQI